MLVSGERVFRWIAERTNDHGGSAGEALGWEREGRLRAGVSYCDWNGPNVVCHIASDGPRWLARGFLWAIFDYPFRQLAVKRITVCVAQGNAASRRFVEHLGFELEAVHPQAHPTGALRTYVMWKTTCRWLNANLYPLRLRLAA